MKHVKKARSLVLLIVLLCFVAVPALGADSQGISLDWYTDGNFSHARVGGSVEQFVVVFSEPVEPGEFEVIIPDKRMNDPWGQGKLGILRQASALSQVMGRPSEAYLDVYADACGSAAPGCASRFIIKLSHDWTEILDTENTGWAYYDEAISQLRLVAVGFRDEEGNRVEAAAGTGTIVAARDVVISKDTASPRVIYQHQVVSRLGNSQYYPGAVRFAFNEPVQIRSELFNWPLTANQGEQRKYAGVHPYQVSYTKLEDAEGNSIAEAVGVSGKYVRSSCLRREHAEGRAVGEPVIFDVDQWDEETRLRCPRNFGWHWFGPTDVLSPGLWLVRVMGITDHAGNVMDYHEMEVVVEDNNFLTVTEITEDQVVFEFAEPATATRNFPVAVEAPSGESMLLWARVSEGDVTSSVDFEVPFETLPNGTWRINGVSFVTQ